jgi:anti-sigma factor RsiW
MKCAEAEELITGLVDDELSGSERASIEGHLKDCPRCQFVYDQEKALKRAVHMAGVSVSAPAALRQKILSDQRIFPVRPESGDVPAWRTRMLFRPAFALALLILLALPALYMMWPAAEAISLTALESYDKILSGQIPVIKAGSQEEIKENLLRSVGGSFAPMGYDLSGMNLRAVGGALQEFNGRKVLVTLYVGEGKAPSLICYTFLGTERDAPEDAEVFFDAEKRMNFFTFSRGGTNGVFHREGKLICILVSKMALPDLLELARSKARPTPL